MVKLDYIKSMRLSQQFSYFNGHEIYNIFFFESFETDVKTLLRNREITCRYHYSDNTKFKFVKQGDLYNYYFKYR